MNKNVLKIIFGVGFLLSIKGIFDSIMLNFQFYNIFSILLFITISLFFYEWYITEKDSSKIIINLIFPFLIVLMGYSFNNREKLFLVLIIFCLLRVAVLAKNKFNKKIQNNFSFIINILYLLISCVMQFLILFNHGSIYFLVAGLLLIIAGQIVQLITGDNSSIYI